MHHSDIAEEIQRRAAVRAPFRAQCVLVLNCDRQLVQGANLSEGGLSCLVDPALGRPDYLMGLTVHVRLTWTAPNSRCAP